MELLRIGNQQAPRDEAVEYARVYLQSPGGGWAYPAYDGYQRASALGPLTDADLLAPILLNVPHFDLPAYYGLLAEIPYFQGILDQLDPDLSLVKATVEDLVLIGQLFAGIDAKRFAGASATIVSKLLHRKRPALIPLQDAQVRACYQLGADAPLPVDTGRSWAEFVPLLATHIQIDLVGQLDTWEEIADLAPGPSISPLRAFDIVAWWMGGRVQR